MMDRVKAWVTTDRAAALLGYVVGAVIGTRLAQGGMTLSAGLWCGIAVLCVIQLRLLLEPRETGVAERV